jgi:8-oxo-dGTP diphosphatase
MVVMKKFSDRVEEELVLTAKNDGIDRLVVGAIILNPEGHFLVLERVSTDFMGGIEELPSGKVEYGENLGTALTREVKEETNLQINDIICYLWYFDYLSGSGKNTRQFNFIVKVDSYSVIIDSNEHISNRWICFDDIEQSKLTSNIVDSLKKYQKEIIKSIRV